MIWAGIYSGSHTGSQTAERYRIRTRSYVRRYASAICHVFILMVDDFRVRLVNRCLEDQGIERLD